MNKAQTIAERLETEEYSLLLPAKSEHLRQYLGNDGLLSNEEICRALYDDALTKKALREKVGQAGVTTDKKLIDDLTSHLWQTHQSVQKVKHLLPAEGIDPKATYRLTIEQRQAQKLEPGKQVVDATPIPKVVVVNGNLLANFLHNYRMNRDMQLRVEKLPANERQSQTNTASLGEKATAEKPSVQATVQEERKPAVELKPALVASAQAPQSSVGTKPKQEPKNLDWDRLAPQLAALGITREQLEKSGQLKQLLAGQQTGPLTYDQKLSNRYVSMTGKLRVVEVNGQYRLRFQPLKDEKVVRALIIPKQVHGYTITPDDRASLIRTGELGRLVQLTDPATKKPYQAYVGTDSRTGQVVVARPEQIKLPKTINGVPLTQTQRELIGQGKAIRLDGLKGENGQTFSAYVQVSAAKKGLNVSTIPANAVRKTTDVKTALDLKRPSDRLEGTTSGHSAKTDNKAKQRQAPTKEPAMREEMNRGVRIR
ncbi:DUF3945 domain-containing protein [Rudanella paleaurantiibacter]|uniref:DUF3945 domain-containing protein n=1 Tax=Rudanella paleaurantiibacter TaxID=2614655 RepID=A0A7J5TST6_9BACT|nr:DUF3945 domain-containing protein [Rudanella paleaurantiibacter]KAB7726660.1 DUF3945 domain-containing protein [Rudanella paleaurantiibacter]